MNPHNHTEKSSAVCLDAAVIKHLRESRQLTQLYVSKVVGVTTDTISRWENKRYPTIRRENALKLAAALEVPLDDILLKPAGESNGPELAGRRNAPLLWLLVAVPVLAAVWLVSSYISSSQPPPVSVTAVRVLPRFAGPGSTVPVQVNLTHRAQGGGFILREYFPKGWKLVEAFPPASSLDNVNGVARWIIKAGDERNRVVYLIQVDPAAQHNSEVSFQGDILSSREGNQTAVPLQGESKMTVAPVHWADADGNGRIDDGEMLEGSFTIEDMAGVHLDWHDLEALWDADSYLWDARKKQFVPKIQKP
jgi:transcriptional regulator with XRE-family HTH domain